MSDDDIDFLDVGNQKFDSSSGFAEHIQENVDTSDLDGKLSIIGSVSNFEDHEEFKSSLRNEFRIIRDSGALMLLESRERTVPIYVHSNDGCPLFFTTGTKTKDIPATIGKYIRSEPNVSRLWVGKRQMEDIRRSIVSSHRDILVPYFTAHYSPRSDVEGVTRPGFERTIQYYGDDGLEAFKEVKNRYGVFPTNVQFKKPGVFKFRITNEGVFTINDGSIKPALKLIRGAIDHLRAVKRAINSSKFRTVESDFGSVPRSEPWIIELGRPLVKQDVQYFEDSLASNGWEFGLSEISKSLDEPVGFHSEIVDQINYGTVGLRTKDEKYIRVFPREITGFGQSIRLYSFINNHIDMNSRPVEA